MKRVVLAGIVLLGAEAARAQSCPAVLPGAGVPQTAVTPVTLHVLQDEIEPVPATDGLVHLAFAAQVTNVGRNRAALTSVVPVDPLAGFAPTGVNRVFDVNGNAIEGMVRLFDPATQTGARTAKQVDFKAMEGGTSGTMFFDVGYASVTDVPRLLAVALTATLAGRIGPLLERTDPIPVSCEPPVVLAPPLTGPGWWDGNGCCSVISPHRGATLPINGALRMPEQFAIDFVQISARQDCCTGPVKDLRSWPFFGAPVLAAADGEVVEAVDGLPEQVPGPPLGVTVENAAGNHVIEKVGDARYVLYAHLKTGSIPPSVRAGNRVAAGARIGSVGNSGSTTAPHLHFQVMDRPSSLNAVGLPFVFDRQVVEGRVIGTAEAADTDYEAGRGIDYERGGGVRAGQMPAEGQVFGFHIAE